MKHLRTEGEIIANWKGDINKPVVSVCCITYNHEPYIEDALEGFLIQETDFPFEILIHDDASTDRTADIIREYEAKYPRLIKPIYQTDNQYSKGLKMNPVFNFPRARGKYLAMCEGDDFWNSNKKIQTQFNILEKEEKDICFHKCVQKNNNTELIISNHGEKYRYFSGEEVLLGGGGFMASSSLFLRKTCLDREFYNALKCSKVGDFVIQCYATRKKSAVYIPIILSQYNSLTNFSVTKKYRKKNSKLNRKKNRCLLKLRLAKIMKYGLRVKVKIISKCAFEIGKEIIKLLK